MVIQDLRAELSTRILRLKPPLKNRVPEPLLGLPNSISDRIRLQPKQFPGIDGVGTESQVGLDRLAQAFGGRIGS